MPTSFSKTWNFFSRLKVTIHPFLIFAILISAITVTALSLKQSSSPLHDSADAGFARDMTAHHEQAVSMSFIIRDISDDEDIRRLAFDIINTQLAQIGMFSGWLEQWELPQTSTAQPLVWAGDEAKITPHASMQGMEMNPSEHVVMMPGMATPEEIEQLKSLKDKDAVNQYLKLMIAHHKGGIMMAQAGLKLAKESEVKRLAQAIANGQRVEIDAMEQMFKR